jgi:hypothetical protein
VTRQSPLADGESDVRSLFPGLKPGKAARSGINTAKATLRTPGHGSLLLRALRQKKLLEMCTLASSPSPRG